MLRSLVFLVVIAVSLPSLISGLDSEAVKELKCFPPPTSEKVGLDLDWFGSVENFYVPLWSKLHAHRTASELLERDSSLISELELGPSSCLTMKKGNLVSGFGREAQYNITGDASSLTFKAPWPGAKSAKFDFHMTDSKSFVLGFACWEDDVSSWAVLSTKQKLEPEVRASILTYIYSLGFRLDFAVDENFAYCGTTQKLVLTYPYFPYHNYYNFNGLLPLGYHK